MIDRVNEKNYITRKKFFQWKNIKYLENNKIYF